MKGVEKMSQIEKCEKCDGRGKVWMGTFLLNSKEGVRENVYESCICEKSLIKK